MFEIHQEALDKNLLSWFAGGPSPLGWTRSGPPIHPCELKITRMNFSNLTPDEILAKNPQEVKNWHLNFLETYLEGGDRTKTGYWNEYLLPRMSEIEANRKCDNFIRLFETFEPIGILPVWVADLEGACDVGFKYFRFDGCHRSCCAKLKGLTTLPALVFSVKNMTEASYIHL